jgi:uncharacterized membrane protein
MAALQWTREHATLLVVIPICNMWAMGWVYTALPLFWLDQGWSLLSLGTLMGLGNAGRAVFTSNLIRYFGDWAVLPWMCVLICGGVVTAARPYEMWAVCVGIAACQNGQFMLALRGLSFFAFSGTGRLRTSAAECSTDFTTTTTSSTRDGSCHDPEHGSLELHNQALRVLTMSEVCGYASATFIGGVLYEVGGWVTCVWWMLAMQAIQIVGLASMAVVREDFRVWWTSSGSSKLATHTTAAEIQVVVSVEAETETEAKKTKRGAVEKNTAKDEDRLAMYSIRGPFAWVIIVHFLNVSAYTVEWALYAVLFKELYQWTSSWIGLSQMAGDLIAASVIGVVNHCSSKPSTSIGNTGSNGAVSNTKTPRPARRCCSRQFFWIAVTPPYSASMIVAFTAMLHLTMAQPYFACAVVAQVLMGTSFVFGSQIVHEMITLYSLGSRARYRRLSYWCEMSFAVGVSLMNFLALYVYSEWGKFTMFYICSATSLVVGVGFTSFFWCRTGVQPLDEVELDRWMRLLEKHNRG